MRSRTAPGRPAVADGRGLTALGAAVVALALGVAGGAVDVLTGSGLRGVFAFCFVIGSALGALLVRREDLRAAVVMPPLVYVLVALIAGLVETSGRAGSFLTQQALELLNSLVLGAPVLLAATAAALAVAVLRHRGRLRV